MSAQERGVCPGEGCLPRRGVSAQERGVRRGVSAQERGVCSGEGCLPRGMSIHGGVCPEGVSAQRCLPGGVSAQVGVC